MTPCEIDGCTHAANYEVCERHFTDTRIEAATAQPSLNLLPCGTVAAYKRHLRNRTPPCAPCLAAGRDEQRARRARKKAST